MKVVVQPIWYIDLFDLWQKIIWSCISFFSWYAYLRIPLNSLLNSNLFNLTHFTLWYIHTNTIKHTNTHTYMISKTLALCSSRKVYLNPFVTLGITCFLICKLPDIEPVIDIRLRNGYCHYWLPTLWQTCINMVKR